MDVEGGTHAFLGDRASDGRALHLTLGVDDDTGVVLKSHRQKICRGRSKDVRTSK